jgi:hypothetical protein
MDDSLVLVKIITVLYLESQGTKGRDTSAKLSKQILEKIKTNENQVSLIDGRDTTAALKQTALYMVDFIDNGSFDREDLLQRLRVNCIGNEELFRCFEQVIGQTYSPEDLKKQTVALRKSLQGLVREIKITDIVKKAYTDITWGREKIDSLDHYLVKLGTDLEPFHKKGTDEDPAVISHVDFESTEMVSSSYTELQKSQNDEGILRTGWKAMNIALQGGFRRGEEWIVPALPHKNKTGLTLSLFKQIAMYNTPYMLDKTKKPLLLRITFEDELPTNMRYLYDNIIFNRTRQMPDITGVTADEMAREVISTMRQTGYSIIMRRVNPSAWTFKNLFDYVLDLEAKGYEIHMVMIDSLYLMSTAGCEEGPSGHALRDLFRRFRNFFSARKTTVITPHQLSTESKQLIRDGHQDFVKALPGKGYFAISKQLDQEVDGEVYLHIEKFNKEHYFTILVGKHRGVPMIDEDLKYVVFKFPKKGAPIPDDLMLEVRTDLTRVGGMVVGSEEKKQDAALEF